MVPTQTVSPHQLPRVTSGHACSSGVCKDFNFFVPTDQKSEGVTYVAKTNKALSIYQPAAIITAPSVLAVATDAFTQNWNTLVGKLYVS